MKTIIYKKRGKVYECTSIVNSQSNDCKILFEEAIDGKIKLGDKILTLIHGVAGLNLSTVSNGEYTPLLIKDGAVFKMEGLIFKDGTISRPMLTDEYLRELSRRIEENAEIIISLEERIAELERKIENTIDF